MKAPRAVEAVRRQMHRAYEQADYWRTRLLLEHRYHAPPEASRTMSPARAAEALGLDREAVWGEGSDRELYEPSPWGVLRRILRQDEVSSGDVFLDLGCGTGRVLLEAAVHYPFQRVVGVELVPRLTEIAREIIARNRPRLDCSDVAVITADLADYEIPDDVTVAYLNNPFRGALFDSIVAKLMASVDRQPRRLRLIYLTPRETSRLERTGRARFVRYGRRKIRRWLPLEYLLMYEIELGRVQTHPGGNP